PLKYEGLSYTEIWISEAQERMVLSVPEAKWPELEALCRSENVEAMVIGRFEPTGRLVLKYHGTTVADMDMNFLHEGRPRVERKAVYEQPAEKPTSDFRFQISDLKSPSANPKSEIRNYKSPADTLLAILSSPNVASKEWVIRQYDHEVQGGSVI